MSVYANVFLWLHWIPPCRFLAAAAAATTAVYVCNRVPRVPVLMYVYSEEQTTDREEEREREKERTDKCTNERNIFKITKRPLINSICDYEEQTSLCDLSCSFLLRMYLMGCPSSFMSLYAPSCSTRITRGKKRRRRKKRQNASIQYRGEKKKRRTIFFLLLDRRGEKKSRAKGKGW